MSYHVPPEPNYDRDIEKLVVMYKRAFRQISQLLPQITSGIERAQADALLRQIEYILRDLNNDAREWCEDIINQAFRDGQASAIYTLGEARTLTEAVGAVSFAMLARETAEAMVADTFQDLLLATDRTSQRIKVLVRNVVAETMRENALRQLGRNTSRRQIVEELTRAGLSRRLSDTGWIGIVDRAGRKWDLTRYAEMVVRTKIQQAHIEGIRTEMVERDLDLAVISSHGAKDACRNYEGMIISMFGRTKGYRTYSELRASNKIFHPNCQHRIHPVSDVSILPKAVRDKHEKQSEALEE